MKPSGWLFHWFSVVAVSCYLLLAAACLMARGRIDPRLIWRVIREPLRRKWRGPLTELRPELGRCFLATVDKRVASDADIGSRLVVLENGIPLALAHCGHDEIRKLGQGRYSHWYNTVYFATSDDTDPRTNGRTYAAEER
jgi:hypothetical protein